MENKILRKEELNRIELNIIDNKFYVQERDNKESYDWIDLQKFQTYQQAETYLNDRIAKKKKGTFKKKEPLKAIYCGYKYGTGEREYSHSKITSIDPSEYSTQCWVSFGPNFKHRNKEGLPLKDIPENWENLEKIRIAKREFEKLEDTLISFTEKELREYFQDK